MSIKLRITTHSGADDIVEVESYDAEEMESKRNDDQIQGIRIGDNVYSRIDLKGVKVIKEGGLAHEFHASSNTHSSSIQISLD